MNNGGKFEEEMASNPCYSVEHLATFGYGPNFGLSCLSDGVKKLKQMELTHAIWAQKMILRLKRDAIVVQDENMEMVEAFHLNLVSEVSAHLSSDSSSSHDLYNNLLIFVVNEGLNNINNNNKQNKAGQKSLLAEMHIFQCVKISAEEVAEDVRQYIKGRFSNVPCGKRENQSFETGRLQLPPFPYYDHSPPAPIFPGSPISNYANEAARFKITGAPNGRPSPSSNGATNGVQNRAYYLDHSQQRQTNGHPTPSNFERDVNTLNRSFDDIEHFVARIQQAAVFQRELEANMAAASRKTGGVRRLVDHHSPSSSTTNGNSPHHAPPPFFPNESEFVDIFQKFKSCFNLLAKLKNHIHEPNAPELLHFLFTPFALILDACTWGLGRHLVSQIFSPPLTPEAKILLENSLNSREKEVWISLGDAWTTPDYNSPNVIIKSSPDFVDYSLGVSKTPCLLPNGKPIDTDHHIMINDKFRRLALEEERLTREKQELAIKEMELKQKELILQNREEHFHKELQSSSRTTPDNGNHNPTNGHSVPLSTALITTKAEIYKENGNLSSSKINGNSHINQTVNGSPSQNANSPTLDQNLYLNRLLEKLKTPCQRPVKIAQVTYDRTGQNEKELSVQKFEYVEVLNNTKKWWECKNGKNETGYVPHTILKILNDQDLQRLMQQQPKDNRNGHAMANGTKTNGLLTSNAEQNNANHNSSYPDYLSSKIGSKGEFRYF